MKAGIRWIEYYLAEKTLTNDELVFGSEKWTAEKLKSKTGIATRHVAGRSECASDLAYTAAKKLLNRQICSLNEIDFVLFCTQSPDYFLPTSACILHKRLNLSSCCGALDFNLGCSGYVYGIGLAKALVESGQAKNILLLTADTYTKFLNPEDISTRSIFSDAGTATLVSNICGEISDSDYISKPVFGTDGSGADNLMVKRGGMRFPLVGRTKKDGKGENYLYMNGPDIFIFTLECVPKLVRDVMAREKKTMDDIDLFFFHQANKYILDHLREKTQVPENKFYTALEYIGNTVSSSIPIAMKCAYDEGAIKTGDHVMLVGFGIGYSWGGTIVSPFI